MTGEGAAVPPPAPARCEPWMLLRTSRAFACVFWGLVTLAGGHAAALSGALPVAPAIGLQMASFLPLACGLWRLRFGGDLVPGWGRRLDWATMLAVASAYLSPFLPWWVAAPERAFFAANAAAHYLATVALLATLNRIAAETGRWLGDSGLRREANAGMGMTLWLSACTALALAWLYHRAGVIEEGISTLLAHASRLPKEARTLFLLPYAMTAYVAWRTKVTGFRRAFLAAKRT